MKQFGYIKIEYSCLESDLFHEDKFDKLHAWIDLVSMAEKEEKSILLNGKPQTIKEGETLISIRNLASRWGWGKHKVELFLKSLSQRNMIDIKSEKSSSILCIIDYISIMGTPEGTPKGTPNYTDNQLVTNTLGTPEGTPKGTPKNEGTPKGTSNYTDNQLVTDTLGTPKGTPRKQNKETEKETKKENLSPVPPIKEINKEKEKEMGLRTREGESLVLTCESPTEKKKPTKKKSEEEYTLTYRARLAFDDFYKGKFGEAYYFSKQDMKMLTELLKKIKYSRTERTKPLSVDDDSLLSAFKELLSMIQTKWILENFSISNITSKYNEIVQDIKNNRNGKSNCTTEQERNRLDSERQRAAIMANVKKLDEQREQWIKAGKPEGSKSERQLSGYDPFDFL